MLGYNKFSNPKLKDKKDFAVKIYFLKISLAQFLKLILHLRVKANLSSIQLGGVSTFCPWDIFRTQKNQAIKVVQIHKDIKL